MTVLICLFSIYPMVKIFQHFPLNYPRLTLFTFYFIPIIWIQSSCTMDYMWALLFILLSYDSYLDKKYKEGAIFLGIAVGFRITSALMIFPFSLQLLFQEKKLKKILPSIILFGATALLAYSPVIVTYQFSFLRYVPNEFPFYIWGYRTLSELFGLPAFILLLLGLTAFLFTFFHNQRIVYKKKEISWSEELSKTKNFTIVILLLIVVIYLLLFLKLPAETAYLIPAIPFSLILINKLFPKKIFTLFCIFIVLHGVVSFFNIDKATFKNQGRIQCIPFDYGTVFKNELKKRAVYKNAQNLLPIVENLPQKDKIAVIISWYYPVVHFLHLESLEETFIGGSIQALHRKGKKLFFLDGVTQKDITFLQKQGFTLYYLDAAEQPAQLANIDLKKYGKKIQNINSYPVNY